MIVWGGFSGAFVFQTLGDGAKYNPQTDTWTPITAIAAPTAHFNHTAVWTGTEMIVWGGSSCTACTNAELNTRARYNPITDTWIPTSTNGAPSARGDHSAVWTGSKMIVWGGRNDATLIDTGGIYDPVSDSWLPTNSSGAPASRSEHAAVWTGSMMIVFGGRASTSTANSFSSGGLYDPTSDGWTPTNTMGAPFARRPSVWSGTDLIVWGDGNGRYNPVTDSWSGISTTGAPSGGSNNSLVWTGSTMITWAGGLGVPPSNTGGIYDPSVDQTP